MQALDSKRQRHCDDIKVRFDSLKDGETFIHKSRVLVKIPTCYKLDAGCPPTLTKVNAVRLADLEDCRENERIGGLPSTFNNDTQVIRRPDAALYLKG